MFIRYFLLSLLLVQLACAQEPQHVTLSARPELSDYTEAYLKFDHDKVAIVDCIIIDGTGGLPKSNQTILIAGDKIIEVGPTHEIIVPDDFHRVSAKGKTVIPGLVGTHNHLRFPQGAIFFTGPRLYLACGVTTMHTCGTGNPTAEIRIGDAIRAGKIPGPEIVHSSQYFTGPDGRDNFNRVINEQKTRNLIAYWAEKGIEWFKVYEGTRPQDLAIIVDEAHKNGAKVTGHLCATTYKEAAELGIDAIEHGFIHSADHIKGRKEGECSRDMAFRSEVAVDSEEVQRVHRAMIENGVALSSTPSVLEVQAYVKADARDLSALAPEHVQRYHKRSARKENQGADWYFKEDWLEKSLAYDLAFFKAGGLLTAGPDPGLHNLPGYGDQKNYELFIKGGFGAHEAIQVMTSNGAQLMERSNIGTIEAGKQADLVLLDGDLEQDPSVIRRMTIVFKDGWAFDPEPLIESVQGLVGSAKDEIVFLGN